jgi:hypothetical protein
MKQHRFRFPDVISMMYRSLVSIDSFLLEGQETGIVSYAEHSFCILASPRHTGDRD